jgi:hypothetical protein
MAMTRHNPGRGQGRRGKRYSDQQVREFELAGGVEGGMPAGKPGGPGESAREPGPGPRPRKGR